jgi:DNA-directed RNA polymerase subunit RPC12/RpoP
MKDKFKKISIKCPYCGGSIQVENTNKPIFCPTCGKEFDPIEGHNYALADWG